MHSEEHKKEHQSILEMSSVLTLKMPPLAFGGKKLEANSAWLSFSEGAIFQTAKLKEGGKRCLREPEQSV